MKVEEKYLKLSQVQTHTVVRTEKQFSIFSPDFPTERGPTTTTLNSPLEREFKPRSSETIFVGFTSNSSSSSSSSSNNSSSGSSSSSSYNNSSSSSSSGSSSNTASLCRLHSWPKAATAAATVCTALDIAQNVLID